MVRVDNVDFIHRVAGLLVDDRVQDTVDVAAVAESTRINLFLQRINLVDQLIRADDLLLQLHVTGLPIDLHDLEVLDVLRDGVDNVGDFLLCGRDLVKFLHDFSLKTFRGFLHVERLVPAFLDLIHHVLACLDLVVDRLEHFLRVIVELLAGGVVFREYRVGSLIRLHEVSSILECRIHFGEGRLHLVFDDIDDADLDILLV